MDLYCLRIQMITNVTLKKKNIPQNIFCLSGGKQHLRQSLTLGTAEVAKVGLVRHRVCLKETDSCTPSERGQLGRSASLEEDRSREMAAQFEEMIRSGRLPPHPMFDSHMAFRHYAPSPMEIAAQRDLFMRIMASQEGARLPHPAFTYFSPAMFNPLAHLQAAAVSQAAAAQAAHLAAAESHRDRHRDRDTKSPREHKRDRDHSKYDKSDKRDKHKDKLERDREAKG